MRRLRIVGAFVLLVAFAWAGIRLTYSQDQEQPCFYYRETGFFVCDEFLSFFETRGGIEVFGYPLTRRFYDPTRGLDIQIFQKGIFEWHPNNPDPYKVQLTLLGHELGYCAPPVPRSEVSILGNGVYFPETGHSLQHGFLDFYRQKGGLDVFGYPCSEFAYKEGRVVQAFQRMLVEWHPEASNSPMRLANVGEVYLERFPERVPGPAREPQDWVVEAGPVDPIKRLDVAASVGRMVVWRGGTQRVHVYVSDQRGMSVEGAQVEMDVRYASGVYRYEFSRTSKNGYTSREFEVPIERPGQKVVIDVSVAYGDHTASKQTFFFTGW